MLGSGAESAGGMAHAASELVASVHAGGEGSVRSLYDAMKSAVRAIHEHVCFCERSRRPICTLNSDYDNTACLYR